MNYRDYPTSAVSLEQFVLERWREEDLFRRTLEATASGREFVFHEGPPTANGRPGIHHVISRTIKDLVCRFQTMRGQHVTRIAGWDTHGLPVEIEAEKKLGINGKREIEALGIAKFNATCRESVFTYKEDWEKLSERIGYWLDYSKPYVTFEKDYIESVWWILNEFNERGLIYRGHKSVPYCPRCGTALSSHEVSLGYEEVEDPSLFFVVPLLQANGQPDPDGRSFLVWTTTPWTLPSNAALALHPDLVYADVEWQGRRYVLAEARVAPVFGADSGVRTVRRYRASELEGERYARPFELVPAPPASDAGWRVVLETFVTAQEGTGIVHIAPAFGADDYASGQKHTLPFLRPIDDAGKFLADVPLVGGRFVKEADDVLLEDLTARGLVFRSTREVHTYPHCWRCSSPLLYVARESWYIRTTVAKAKLLEHNAQVDWHPPEVGAGRFGEWLEGNVDWALSRERYWGTPLPAWVCDRNARHIDFVGSYARLGELAGRDIPSDFDPHKPYIDEWMWRCRQSGETGGACGGTMRRTPEVIDVWFDSGAMPYAQWHYPFENQDEFRRHFPADYICEAVDQTRGWFYSLLAISTLLDLGPAYRHVVVNDMVLDAQGLKMSKSKGNVVDPWQVIGVHGADAIRWYFVTVSQPWVPKRFDADAMSESVRRIFDTLAHTYRFFSLYANLENWQPTDADPPLAARSTMDRWVLSRVTGLAALVHEDLAGYDLTRAARAIGEFIVDDLSNWYVRCSRDRFYGRAGHGNEADTRGAFATLREVLVAVTKLLAPFVPFHADWLHRALCDDRSVHLERFPSAEAGGEAPGLHDAPLEAAMDAVRELVRLGRAVREKVRIRVRQPLRTLYAVMPDGATVDGDLIELLKAELNIKDVRFPDRAEELLSWKATPNFRLLGKRFGGRTQEAASRIRELPSDMVAAFRQSGSLSIVVNGEPFALSGEEIEIREEPRGELVVETEGGYTVAIDATIDDELRMEGLARELVNRIQRQRRESKLEVSDRIRLGIFGEPSIIDAATRHRASIMHETLAVDLETGKEPAGSHDSMQSADLDGIMAIIGLSRVQA